MSNVNKGDRRPGEMAPSPAGTATPPSSTDTQIGRDAAAAKRSAGDAMENAEQKAGELGEQAKQSAHDMAEEAKQQARSYADERKEEAAGRVGGMADALRSAAGSLDEQDQQAFAGYARQAAAGLEKVSDSLSRRSIDDLVETVEDFAQRQPVAFLGGAVLAGFVLARFAKSSSERRHAASYNRDEDRAHRLATGHGPSSNVYNPGGMAPDNPTRHRDVDTSTGGTL